MWELCKFSFKFTFVTLLLPWAIAVKGGAILLSILSIPCAALPQLFPKKSVKFCNTCTASVKEKFLCAIYKHFVCSVQQPKSREWKAAPAAVIRLIEKNKLINNIPEPALSQNQHTQNACVRMACCSSSIANGKQNWKWWVSAKREPTTKSK